MRLNAPKGVTWTISLVFGVLGILLHTGTIYVQNLNAYSFWMVAIAWILLALATLFKGL